MEEKYINEVKQISDLTDEERRLLTEMKPALEKHAPAIVEAFYAQLEQNSHAHALLHAEDGRVERLKGHLSRWLLSLADGTYGSDYFDERYRIGHRHVEVGLEPRYVIAAMSFCRATAVNHIIETEYADDAQRGARARALNKIMDIDLNIMLQSYDDKRIQQFLEVTGFSKELFENLISGEV